MKEFRNWNANEWRFFCYQKIVKCLFNSLCELLDRLLYCTVKYTDSKFVPFKWERRGKDLLLLGLGEKEKEAKKALFRGEGEEGFAVL